MATEEQTAQNDTEIIGFSSTETLRAGQKLTISGRYVTKLGFWLKKQGSPTGSITFSIYATDDEELLASKVLGDASTLTTSLIYYEVTFNLPVYINEEVRLVVVKDTNLSTSNHILSADQSGGSVKANEVFTRYRNGVWVDSSSADMTYIYTYDPGGGSIAAPSVTTQAISNLSTTTATGNGNVTSLGTPAATLYGHCWAIHPTPTTASSKTEGVPSAIGAFTSGITGLEQNTTYYSRAYITSALGTFYGALVQFTTSPSTPIVTTDLVTGIAATTALGHGSIDNNGGSAVTEHGVCWGTSANPTTADSLTEEGTTDIIGDFDSLMTGLTAETTYHVRAYATNDAGTGYGADITFITFAVGAPIVTTQAATDVSGTSALGHGTIIFIGQSAVTEHGHCWATTASPTTSASKTTNGVGSIGAFTSVITGLAAATQYYIRAYATNTQGTSYGDNVIIREVAGELVGEITLLGEYQVYTSRSGKQRALLGVEF